MKALPLFLIGVLCSAVWAAAEPARLSIAEVLHPETRLAAFRRYCLSAEQREDMRWLLTDLRTFARFHAGLHVSVSPAAPGGPRYLLTWHSEENDQTNWDAQEGTPEKPALESEVLRPQRMVYAQSFDGEGEPTGKEELASDSVLIDVDGDGDPERIEQMEYKIAGAAADPNDRGWHGQYFKVTQSHSPNLSLAALYNVWPDGRGLQSTWGWQVRPGRSGEGCAIELGPLADASGAEAAVVFRWDAATKKWLLPTQKPDSHFVILSSPQAGEALTDDVARREAELAVRGGRLRLPLREPPTNLPPPGQPRINSFRTENVPKDELSKPYQRRPLAGLSPEETLAYMGARPSVYEYLRAKMPKPADVPDLWSQEPAQAALAYVRAHRPPELDSRFVYRFASSPGEKPPDEGDFTLTDGPSGCFSPSGAYVHHLHCAPQGSFLVFVRTLQPLFGVSHIVNHDRAEVRQVDLSHEQARRLLQTLWWMSRLRTRALTNDLYMEFMGGGSTSDGQATVQIVTPQEKVSITDTRADSYVADYMGQSLGVSAFSTGYSATAFLNLTARLFEREVPAWLGAAWTSQAPASEEKGWPFEEVQPPADFAAVRPRVAALLQLATEGKMAPDVTGPAVEVAGRHGWREMRPWLEKLAAQLPPLFAWEVRIEEIGQETKVWQEKFGEAASERASARRSSASLFDEAAPAGQSLSAIPGLAPETPPLLEKMRKLTTRDKQKEEEKRKQREERRREKEKFSALDALYAEQSSTRYGAPHREQEISSLRTLIPYALRQMELYDDPAALFRWARDEGGSAHFALPRLAILDPPRALQLLDWWEKQDPREEQKAQFARDRATLAGRAWVNDAPLSREKRAYFLARLRKKGASDQDRWERLGALQKLLPPSEPTRYRDASLDTALLGYLRTMAQKGESAERDLATAAAVRLGSKAWDAILGAPARPERSWFFSHHLPALSLLAEREPRLFHEKLRRLLAPQLEESRGELDAVLFAIWRNDLRELRPALGQIATHGPEDFEGDLTHSYGGSVRPVDGQRYHRARHILALWDEPDAFTRARLLIAFGVASEDDFSRPPDGALAYLCQSLRPASLTPEQRSALREWVDWCEQNAERQLNQRLPSMPATLKEIRVTLAEKSQAK